MKDFLLTRDEGMAGSHLAKSVGLRSNVSYLLYADFVKIVDRRSPWNIWLLGDYAVSANSIGRVRYASNVSIKMPLIHGMGWCAVRVDAKEIKSATGLIGKEF